MSLCLPKYEQSSFVARADQFEPMEEPAIDTGRSSPKTSFPKKLEGNGEPTIEGKRNGDPNLSSPHADQPEQDTGTSKELPFNIEDFPKFEKIFTYTTAPESHSFQINRLVVRTELSKQEIKEPVVKLAEDIFNSFANTAVEVVCASLQKIYLSIRGKIANARKELDGRIDIIQQFASDNSDLLIKALDTLK